MSIPQYGPGKILLVWLLAAMPMGLLGWIVAPALAAGSNAPILVRIAVLTVGLVWQFAVVVVLIYGEVRTLKWPVVKERLWLTAPRSLDTGAERRRLWWWLIPVVALTAIFDLRVKGFIDRLWVSVFPFLAEPSGWSLGDALATPAARSQMAGAWGTWVLYLTNAAFNTVLGEELLFRGVLLPRMAGVFGNRDWAANGLLFGVYHLHQPWGMVSSVIHGAFLFALPTRYFRSAWFGIAAHSGQSIFFGFLMLGLVLGWG